MPAQTTVFVVDDHELARNSVCALVESMGVHAEAYASAEGFLAAYTPDRPGCLVTDYRMLGMSGIELQQQLAARRFALPVIVITAYATPQLAVQAMKQGAITLLEKPCSDHELGDAIREALDRDAEQRRVARRKEEIRRKFAALTPQERAVLDQIVAGKLNKVIARELDVSVRTVESRRHNIFRKLDVDSVAELVRLAVDVEEST